MKNFSILMLAMAFCVFTQDANAQDKKTANPKILDEKTWTWEPTSEFNYANFKDMTFEVGMGNEKNGVGIAEVGLEIETAQRISVTVAASPFFTRNDDNSFAGFMVDYHTAGGYTKRVALPMGFYSQKKWGKNPVWGTVTVPDQFVDQGKKKEYNLDLKKWAPEGWDGKVWFSVSLQNSGRNTYLKGTVQLVGGQEKVDVTQKPKEEPGKKEGKSTPTFVPLDISDAATVASTRIFNQESIVFPQWGKQTHHGVPFVVNDPDGGKTKNAICLYSPMGAVSSKMPNTVRLGCDLSAKEIHVLGAAGWGVPWFQAKNTLSMVMRVEYADGDKEEHQVINGVHLTDWAKGPDVPGSKNIGVSQVRYFSIVPKRQNAVIRSIEFRKGTDQTSPLVMALTVETPVIQVAQKPKEEPGKKSGGKDDKILMQGTWHLVDKKFPGGKEVPKDDARWHQTLEIDGNVLSLKVKALDRPAEGTFLLTPTDKPKSIDFSGKGPAGFDMEFAGIYEISENTLKLSIMYGPNAKTNRVREFDGPNGGDYFVFKRSVEKTEVAQKPKEDNSTKGETPNYYPLQVGNEWHDKVSANGNSIDTIRRIIKLEGIGDKQIAVVETTINGKTTVPVRQTTSTEHLSQTNEGVFRHREDGLDFSPPVCLLKYPIVADAKWQGEYKVGKALVRYTAEAHEDTLLVTDEKLKTIRVEMRFVFDRNIVNQTSWFANNIGIVKHTSDSGKTLVVLTKRKGAGAWIALEKAEQVRPGQAGFSTLPMSAKEQREAFAKQIDKVKNDKDYLPPKGFLESEDTFDGLKSLLGQPSEVERSRMDKKGILCIWNRGKSGYVAIYFVDGGGILVRGGIFAYGTNRQNIDQWKRFMRGEGPAPD